jgi:hypothetical protein
MRLVGVKKDALITGFVYQHHFSSLNCLLSMKPAYMLVFILSTVLIVFGIHWLG